MPPHTLQSVRDGIAHLREDLRSGRAGALLRVGLSLAIAAFILGCLLLLLGLWEMAAGGVEDPHFALAIAFGAAVWFWMLLKIWAGFRRYRVIRAVLIVLGVWCVAIPLCALMDSVVRSAEFLLTGMVFLAVAASLSVLVSIGYHGLGGKPVRRADGSVRVDCPQCGYSLVGLDACHCPECGHHTTLDELILAQDFAALRATRPAFREEESESESATDPDVSSTPTPSRLQTE